MYGLNFYFYLSIFLKEIQELFNSAFVSALAGAGLGAWSAYLTARNAVLRKERLDSYRKSNNAVVIVGTITNIAINLKTQFVTPLVRSFKEDQTRVENIRTNALLTGNYSEIHLTANMNKITPLTLPIDAMKNFIYSMDISPGFAIALTAMVEQSATELNQVISTRSALIDKFQNLDKNDENWAFNFLGLVRSDGNVDSLYADLIDILEKYTDDLIFFSAKLAEELTNHNKQMLFKYPTLAHKNSKPYSVSFSALRDRGIVPPDTAYASWLASFKREPSAAV